MVLTTSDSTPGRVATLEAQDGSGTWQAMATMTLPEGTSTRFAAVVPATEVRGRPLRVHLAAYSGLEQVTTAVLVPPSISLDARVEDRSAELAVATSGQVDKVRFFVDGARVLEDVSPPWTLDLPDVGGRHDVVARAFGPLESVLSEVVEYTVPVDAVQYDTGMAAGFRLETAQSGFDLPTSAAVADAGLVLVSEKSGVVKALSSDGAGGWELPREVLDLRDLVFDEGDAGLVGIAVDPDFADTGFVYLSHALDEGTDPSGWKSQQVARYHWDGTRLDPASRHVVLGSVTGSACHAPQNVRTPDCMPLLGSAHTVGDLAFDGSGNLLVGVGDSALSPGELKARTHALRVQDPEVLVGKVLRVDPQSGRGVPGNPMYAGDGSANSSRVLAMGLRNPFRFVVVGDHVVLGDVGESSFEEIDVVHLDQPAGAPANYGWPCLEAGMPTDLGDVEDPDNPWHACAAVRDDETEAPAHAYEHTTGGGSITAGLPLDGSGYPESVRGLFLYGDYAQNHLRTVSLPHGGVASPGPAIADSTAAGGPVKIFRGPDGWAWTISIYTGSLQRLTWSADATSETCATGEFRRGFHDLDGPESTFDREYPEGPWKWLTPYNDTHLPAEVLAPVECVPDTRLAQTSGSPWLTGDAQDLRDHPGDRFGVSWRGRVQLEGGTYQFRVRGSEWIRLRVDDVLVHDFYANDYWGDHRNHDVVLQPGLHTVSAEYLHGDQDLAHATIAWEQIGRPPEVHLAVPSVAIPDDGDLAWLVDVSDPDGDSQEALLSRTRVVAELLHYDEEAYHVHPYREVVGQASGTMALDDVHAPGSGVVRLWAESTDASGDTGRSTPVYACFADGDVGPCAD